MKWTHEAGGLVLQWYDCAGNLRKKYLKERFGRIGNDDFKTETWAEAMILAEDVALKLLREEQRERVVKMRTDRVRQLASAKLKAELAMILAGDKGEADAKV